MEFKRDPEFTKKRIQAMKERKENPNPNNRDFLFKKKYEQFKPQNGENIIRILPAMWKDAMFPWYEVFIHYKVGPNNSQFFCPAKMLNKPCPICEEINRLKEQGVDKKELDKMGANHRAIAWVIDRTEEKKGPLLWIMPYTKIAQEIITISFSRKTGEPEMVDDPETGRDILFNKTGNQLNTQYSGVRKDDERSALHADEEVMSKWIKFAENEAIPSIVNFADYDHIKNVITGGESEPSSDAPITSEDTKKSEPEVKTEEKPKEAGKIPVGEGLSKAKLKAMSRSDLIDLIEARKLDVDADEWPDDGDFAEAISLELGL